MEEFYCKSTLVCLDVSNLAFHGLGGPTKKATASPNTRSKQQPEKVDPESDGELF